MGNGVHQRYFRYFYKVRFASDPPQQALQLLIRLRVTSSPGKYPVVYTNITFLGRKADVLGLSTIEIALFNPLLSSRNTSRPYQAHSLLQSEPGYIRGWGICTLVRNLPLVAVEDCYD